MSRSGRARCAVVALSSLIVVGASGGVGHATDVPFGPLGAYSDYRGVFVSGQGVDDSTSASLYDGDGNLIKTCSPVGGGQFPCTYSYRTLLIPLSGQLPPGHYTVNVVKIGYGSGVTFTVSPPPPPPPPPPDPYKVTLGPPQLSLGFTRPIVGQAITASANNGPWGDAPVVTKAWYTCVDGRGPLDSGSSCVVVGAGAAYTPQLADVGRVLYFAETAGNEHETARVEKYAGSGAVQRSPTEWPWNHMGAGEMLQNGWSMWSTNRAYLFVMQTDGNAVEHGPAGVVWTTCTFGSNYRFNVRVDGTIAVIGPLGGIKWQTNTLNTGSNHTFTVQDDGNMVLRKQSGVVVWQSATHHRTSC